MLYKMIELNDEYYEDPQGLQYVGVYVTRWGDADEPTVGFVEATDEEISEYINNG